MCLNFNKEYYLFTWGCNMLFRFFNDTSLKVVQKSFPAELSNIKFIKLNGIIYINQSYLFENSRIEYILLKREHYL